MRLMKYLTWALNKTRLQKSLRQFCEIEYSPADADWAYEQALRSCKTQFFK